MLTGMGQAWVALVGALGGVLLGGVMSLSTATFTHRWQLSERQDERSERMRNKREESSVAFLLAADRFLSEVDVAFAVGAAANDDGAGSKSELVSRSSEDLVSAIKQRQETYIRVTVTNGDAVRRLALEYLKNLQEIQAAVSEADHTRYSNAMDAGTAVRERLRDAIRRELGVED